MDIASFLSQNDVVLDVRTSDKTKLLQDLCSQAAGEVALDTDVISTEILKREELGSTGVGSGVAIPHARIPGLEKPFGVLARLKKLSCAIDAEHRVASEIAARRQAHGFGGIAKQFQALRIRLRDCLQHRCRRFRIGANVR
ncbi:MAG: PTS sugar transporter subunit IIA [Burkholderiales bacterium]